jgi:hypothetical protein
MKISKILSSAILLIVANFIQINFAQARNSKIDFSSAIDLPESSKTTLKSSLSEDVPMVESQDLKNMFLEAEKYYRAALNWKKIKCEPKSGFICSKWECIKREATTYLILDKENEKITRCEKNFCESFIANFRQTGVFTNIQTEGPIGTLIRILGDNRYKEITTIGLDAYISNGNCEIMLDQENSEEKSDENSTSSQS